jgi:Kef-type K+ transport system membrane component KefB
LASIVFAQDHHRLQQVFITLLFLVIAIGCVFLFSRLRSDRTSSMILRWLGDNEILPVRASLLLLMGFVCLADRFGIEIVIGAYAAGLAVAMLVEGTQAQVLEDRLTMIGASFFVPVFFIASGVELDISTLVSGPLSVARVLLFCLLLLFIRAAPLQIYRRALDKRESPAFALFTSITLPLVLAITYLGARKGQMSAENAAALVGAAVITVTIFPTLALSICSAKQDSRPPGAIEGFIQRSAEWIMMQVDAIFLGARRK